MKTLQWKDPIVEEVRKVRKQFDQELKIDPQGFMKRALKEAAEAGFKISTLKPVKPAVSHFLTSKKEVRISSRKK